MSSLVSLFQWGMKVPGLQKALWKKWYNYLATKLEGEDWAFMNYGYAHLDGEPVRVPDGIQEIPEKFCLQLYHQVAGAVDLAGKHVMEVGCGRGGGSAYVARQLKPATMTGADLSPSAIELCWRQHQYNGLTFEVGDAENIPFEAERFDAVVNVESSHCYPSMEAFLDQVARVLKAGGHFLWADLRKAYKMGPLKGMVEKAGLKIVDERDITQNVLKALDLDHDRKMALINQLTPKFLLKTVQDFAGVRGSRIWNYFSDGTSQYLQLVAEKES